jgi:HPt (histidine-containing phosphotransfer) domain-containing protein
MSPNVPERSCQIFKLECEDGQRYVVYNASIIGSSSDHVPGKWYFQPYPAPLGLKPSESFDSAEEATERATEVAAERFQKRERRQGAINRLDSAPDVPGRPRPAAENRLTPLLSPTVLLAACGDDVDGLRVLCQAFQTHAPSQLAAVDNALRDRNGPDLREATHKLCAILTVFSSVAGSLASVIEKQAALGRLEQAQPLIQRLAVMVRELHQEIDILSLESLRSQRGLAEGLNRSSD